MRRYACWVLFGCLAPLASALGASTGPLVIEDLTSQTVTADNRAGHFQQAVGVSQDGQSVSNEAGLFELTNQLQLYQQQLAEMRGEIEELRNTIELMKVSDRERYLDLDMRINALSDQGAAPVADTVAVGAQASTPRAGQDAEAGKAGEAAYLAARNQILSGDQAAAIKAFNAYLTDYPKGKYVPDTHYWLGEMYRAEGSSASLDKAAKEFALLADTYPDSPKAPTALYKLAEVQSKQGKLPATKVSLNRLIKQFPNSDEASLARQMLQTL